MGRSFLSCLPVCLLTASGLILTAAHATEPTLPAPMTSEQDHQNMMDQLHIAALRPGVDGFNPQAPTPRMLGR